MKKLKYFSAFILATTAIVAFEFNGLWTWFPLLFSFAFIPLIELFFKPGHGNLSPEEQDSYAKDPFFKWILYIIAPLQVAFLIYFLEVMGQPMSTSEFWGRITAMGVLCGIFGINVGHELGHRSNRFERLLGELLLLTSLETHFVPFHNKGHHYFVATPEDPATARRNETVYQFWFRSQIGSYFQAWKIVLRDLRKKDKPFFSTANNMLIYTLAQLALLTLIYSYYGLEILFAFLAAALFCIMMLETVNYIEHYGLLRKKNPTGNYERVRPWHSWNSDHQVGRSILFELSRHSDHHYKASKPYQLLESMPDSPQMVTGYPGMMLLSLVPPLWFRIMHRQMAKYEH
jgi:alkane 1-monooxygenase